MKLKNTDIAILSLIDVKRSHPSKIARDLGKNRRTIHRHLTPLEDEGLVEGQYSQDKGRPMIMKQYSLTSKGKQALKTLKSQKISRE
jgi:predicted ArsR family transcriptional regulator